jgi:hypothetical protein
MLNILRNFVAVLGISRLSQALDPAPKHELSQAPGQKLRFTVNLDFLDVERGIFSTVTVQSVLQHFNQEGVWVLYLLYERTKLATSQWWLIYSTVQHMRHQSRYGNN